MKTSLPQRVSQFYQTRRRKQRWFRAVSALACVVVFCTVYALILPAITLEKDNPRLEAEAASASPGDVLTLHVTAQPDGEAESTVFYLAVQQDNAGLYEEALSEAFDEEGTAWLLDDGGQELALHREYEADGTVGYWFTLPASEEATSLTLSWVNGVGQMVPVEIEEEEPPEEIPETPEAPGETPETPGETPETPDETPETPGETPDTPGETPETPDETPEAPGETPETPGETPETPDETPETPGETPETPDETPETPGETPEIPGETPDTPGETPETPGETPDTPGETPEAPDETPEAPEEAPETPDKPPEESTADPAEPPSASEESSTPSESDSAAAEEAGAASEEASESTEEPATSAGESAGPEDRGGGLLESLMTLFSGGASSGEDSASQEEILESLAFEEGDRDAEGSVVITAGSGETLEEAKRAAERNDENTVTLSWLEELPEEPVYICGLEEHLHDESCYDAEGNLICGLEEHVHDESCLAELPAEVPEEPVYICGLEEHLHDETCYDAEGNLICGLEEHVHDESCLAELPAEVEPEESVFVCGLEAHTHDEACYDEAGELICGLEEHIHGLDCLTEEDRTRVEEAIARIDELPSPEEIEETLAAYDEAGDEDGYEAYYEELYHQVMEAYLLYEDIGVDLQQLVSNSDKLLAFEWLYSAQTLALTNEITVQQVNCFGAAWGGTDKILLIYNGSDADKTAIGVVSNVYHFYDATSITVENRNGQLVVNEIDVASGSDKQTKSVPAKGFIIIIPTGASIAAEVGSYVTVDFDYTKKDFNVNGLGTVKFTSSARQKTAKDNSSQLHVVGAASTRDFIELNLYDYGSGSTGQNINDKFNADKKMPGFQQSGGTNNIPSLDYFKGTGYMNFGDIVTDDLADGRLVTLASENPQGINVVKDTANSPISRYSDVMSKNLVNGYPALADGTSLGYLFGGESYSKKMNSQSIDGLFQYNETTGAYTFNSRENFAQFNSGSDTFTLYNEMFTPNFIMYPFGNFMPFNDIVHDSKQVSQIDEDYFNELYLQANYLYQQGKGDQYAQLAKVLGQFMDYAQQDNWGADWTAERALEHYFYWGSELPKPDDKDNNYKQISLDDLYSLDYDVESDFYFGMEMKMNFMQPKGGLTGKDGQQPMVFYFTGDDDVWVYIDGKLFLDLSGIHRHVGGEIDFVNGVVKYYSLDTMTGDVSTTPYKTVKFSELVDASLLNEKGTFQDYSTHSFNFYYMERGSGSSVCRLNFNFPLLRKNSISVSKELSVDQQDKLDLLGNPDFRFQVLKEGGTELFIGENASYDILDSSGNKTGSGTTDANGVFTLKAGQTAVFGGIEENSGKYFVRELLDPDAFKQYGSISVDGSSQTENYDVTVGSDTFKGVDSPVKDMSSGSTVFHFNNQVTFNKLGSLSITKKLETYPKARSVPQFRFQVTLDDQPLPVGTAYTVGDETRTVTEAGIIPLAPDETAVIANILAGSRFTVREEAASAGGYTVTYAGEDLTQGSDENGAYVSGVIKTNAEVAVTVTNSERGVSVDIPGVKTLQNADAVERTFTFLLTEVTASGESVEGGTTQEAAVQFPQAEGQTASFRFSLSYLEKDITAYPATFYYQITEKDEAVPGVGYDKTVYRVKVTVTQTDGVTSAQVTGLWKDGTEIEQIGSISFENTVLQYELPQTGGAGTSMYTVGGLCLMAGALLLLYGSKTRGKGGKEHPC